MLLPVLASCNKDHEFVPAKEYLLNGGQEKSWTVTAFSVDGEDQFEVKWPEACQRDEVLVLKAEDIYEVTKGAEVCDSLNSVLSGAGLWYVSEANEEFVLMDAEGVTTLEAELKSVSGSKFVIEETLENGAVWEYTFEAL